MKQLFFMAAEYEVEIPHTETVWENVSKFVSKACGYDGVTSPLIPTQNDNISLVHCVDMHTAGEPLRILAAPVGTKGADARDSGWRMLPLPDPTQYDSILEYRDSFMKTQNQLGKGKDMASFDSSRKVMMHEPRGHRDMYGCIITPRFKGKTKEAGQSISTNTTDAHIGALFFHHEGYSTMCGHAIIAVTSLVAKLQWWRKMPKEESDVAKNQNGEFLRKAKLLVLRINAPCGLVVSYARLEPEICRLSGVWRGNYVPSGLVAFNSVPCFALDPIKVPVDLIASTLEDLPCLDESEDSSSVISVDIGYGGTFYGYVDADELGLHICSLCEPRNEQVKPFSSQLISRLGGKIREVIQQRIATPAEKLKAQAYKKCGISLEEDLCFLYGTIFTSFSCQCQRKGNVQLHSRHVCVFGGDAQIDRSPTGSGVSGRAAVLHSKGELKQIKTWSGQCLNNERPWAEARYLDPEIDHSVPPEGSIAIGSCIGTTFHVGVSQELEDSEGGQAKAIIAHVQGTASITGFNTLVVTDDDDLPEGFGI
eukprot:Nk52_evm6s382 gene=Nk52_evmTU6s382